ncbi:MAG TPA: hypothetical protein VN822_13240 [Candidatus Acidoferrales bacterium]|nr:hypothetical protein [Candidatus Acidoferrales bacterium]
MNFDGFWDADTRGNIEHAIRACVGEPPKDEEWVVSVVRQFPFQPCAVQVKTLKQTRSRLFFENSPALSKAIPDWLKLYPLK